jgi:hypothetical protein
MTENGLCKREAPPNPIQPNTQHPIRKAYHANQSRTCNSLSETPRHRSSQLSKIQTPKLLNKAQICDLTCTTFLLLPPNGSFPPPSLSPAPTPTPALSLSLSLSKAFLSTMHTHNHDLKYLQLLLPPNVLPDTLQTPPPRSPAYMWVPTQRRTPPHIGG